MPYLYIKFQKNRSNLVEKNFFLGVWGGQGGQFYVFVSEGSLSKLHSEVLEKRIQTIRFAKQKKRFTKDIQIQICKPKSKETPMKSNTRHADGEGSNPFVHEKIHGKDEVWEKWQIQQKHTNPNRSAKEEANAYEIKNTTR